MSEAGVARVVAYAVEVARPERVILFGSRAAGTEDVHSDVDLLVVARWSYGRRETERRIRDFAAGHGLRTDVLIRTPQEVEEASRPGRFSVIVSALTQGRVVYERSRGPLK